MRTSKRFVSVSSKWRPGVDVLFVLAWLSPALSSAQAPQRTDPARQEIIAAARDIVSNARFCTFVTLGEDGHPQARIVDPLAPDADFSIWFATNPLTRKVQEVRRDARVTLSCFDTTTASYVTVLGRAALVSDANEKTAHWKDDWNRIYPNGARGNDVVLIRISPRRLEIVSESRGIHSDPKTWTPTVVEFINPPAEDDIRHARTAQNEAIAAGDFARAAAFWTDDVTVRRALGLALHGRAAARKALAPAPSPAPRIVYQRLTHHVDVSSQWPLAFENGVWEGHLGAASGPTVIGGQFSAQWVKRDGRWLIRSEVFVALTCSGVGCESPAVP